MNAKQEIEYLLFIVFLFFVANLIIAVTSSQIKKGK